MALGSILFMKSNSPQSKVIRLISRGKFSHCCISLNQENTVVISTNIFDKLRVKVNKNKNYKVVDIDLTDEQRLQIIDFLLSKYNYGYDYWLIVGLALKFLGFIKDATRFNKKGRFMCSEVTDQAFLGVGIDLFPSRSDSGISPSELYDALTTRK